MCGKYNKYVKYIITFLYIIILTGCGNCSGLPESYDARKEGIVTSVKNQGNKPLCWAYALTAAMESHILKKRIEGFDTSLDLSEEQVINNTVDENSNSINVWTFLGPIKEDVFNKHSDMDEEIQIFELDIRVKNIHPCLRSVIQYKKSLIYEGPSYISFKSCEDFNHYWYNSKEGDVYTYDGKSKFKIYHAVLLIGWDDTKNAWLCKNSWGRTGPNKDGTFWISYKCLKSLDLYMMNFDIYTLGESNASTCI